VSIMLQVDEKSKRIIIKKEDVDGCEFLSMVIVIREDTYMSLLLTPQEATQVCDCLISTLETFKDYK
jgi:hypothetical protein